MIVNQVNTSSLAICPRCFEVCGTVSTGGVTYRQICACRSSRAWHRLKIPPGYDYATYVEMCRACGLEAISSGSRWSQFFCPSCHDAIRALNRSAGFAVIPIGRHSIMNSFSLSGPGAADPAKIDEFVRKMKDLSSRSATLDDWRRLMVASRCAELGLREGDPVPLNTFIRKAKNLDRESIKKTSLRKLFAFFDIPEWLVRSEASLSMN